MDPSLRFPNQHQLKECLCRHPLLGTEYYKEKGITEAVAKAAAEQFADSTVEMSDVKSETAFMMYQLQSRKGDFTTKLLPYLGDNKLDLNFLTLLSMSTTKALTDCAEKKV